MIGYNIIVRDKEWGNPRKTWEFGMGIGQSAYPVMDDYDDKIVHSK